MLVPINPLHSEKCECELTEVQDLLTLWGQEVVVNVSNGSTEEKESK